MQGIFETQNVQHLHDSISEIPLQTNLLIIAECCWTFCNVGTIPRAF